MTNWKEEFEEVELDRNRWRELSHLQQAKMAKLEQRIQRLLIAAERLYNADPQDVPAMEFAYMELGEAVRGE